MIIPVAPKLASHPRHSAKDLRRRLGRNIGLAALSVVLFVTSFGAFVWADLQGSITRVDIEDIVGNNRPSREAVPDDYAGHAVNILVLGSDSRSGANNVDGSQGHEEVLQARSDTAMIMHVAADRSRIEIVSIPRDTIVTIPECTQPGGKTTKQHRGQFNEAFADGAGDGASTEAIAAGAACTIKTVEELTDVRIDEFMVVDFSGLQTMVDSLGGVKVYVDEEIDDDHTGLQLPVGCHELDGQSALGYARARYGVGDGSDISRIARQQNLMAAMLRTAQRKNLLTNADDLYSFAKSSLSTLTTSEKIGDLKVLAGLAQSISKLGMDHVRFVTMPNGPSPSDPNRVVPTDAAKDVWAALKADKAVPDSSVTTEGDGSPAPSPDADQSGTTGSTDGTGGTTGQAPQPADPGTGSQAPAAPSPTPDPAAQCYAQ